MARRSRAQLLSAIRTHPTDDDLRLVYADALEEAGELPRADLIRIQVELARGPTEALRARERAHLTRYEADLAPPHATSWRFDRGLAVEAAADAQTWIAHGKAMLAAAPIATIAIDDPEGDWDPMATARELATKSWLRWITAIHIGLYREIGEPKVLAVVLGSRHLARLEVLALAHPLVVIAAAKCELAKLAGVLVYCEGANEGDRALSALKHHAGIERLQIVGCGVTDRGARTVAAAGWKLRYLVFGGTHYQADAIGDAGMQAIVKIDSLERLGLEGAGIDDAGLARLARSNLRLHQLNVCDNAAITDAGIAELARSPVLATLRSIDLGTTSVTAAGREALLRSPHARADLVVEDRGSLCCWMG
ncbi:MAG: TIGR02996 domain-containing protein [Kofleriaceae bacterium]